MSTKLTKPIGWSGITLNGEPMVWMTVDEMYNPETSDCWWQAFLSDYKDYLVPLSQFDPYNIPDNYWERVPYHVNPKS